jgi:sugar lactone lactonase YvrE
MQRTFGSTMVKETLETLSRIEESSIVCAIQRRGKLCTRFALIMLAVAAVFQGGCGRAAGVIFEPPENALRWPPPPDPARIHFVGTLRTDMDLKPARSFAQGIKETLFGKDTTRSMLTPYALCMDENNRVFVCDSNAQVVHVFNLDTREYEQWKPDETGVPFAQPVGIAYDPAGRLLVSDAVAGVIHVFDDNGSDLGTLGDEYLTKPSGLAIDPSASRLFVADVGTHQIVVLSLDGALIGRIGERGIKLGQFNYPTNVAVGQDGSLYVSDTLNFRVQVFDRDLQPIRQIGSKGDLPGYFSHPKGLALDSEDHLYVIDTHFESVQIFDQMGDLLMTFGEEGHGPGQFWLPTGIYIDVDDRIWIADSYNQRLEIFSYSPPEEQP